MPGQIGPDQEQLGRSEQIATATADAWNACAAFVLQAVRSGPVLTERDRIGLGIAMLQDYANGWRPNKEEQ